MEQVVPILVPLRQIYMHNPDKKSDVSEGEILMYFYVFM